MFNSPTQITIIYLSFFDPYVILSFFLSAGVSDEDLDKAITAVTKAPSSDPMDDFADPDLDADIDADDMTNDDMTNDDMHSLSRQSMRSASVDVRIVCLIFMLVLVYSGHAAPLLSCLFVINSHLTFVIFFFSLSNFSNFPTGRGH